MHEDKEFAEKILVQDDPEKIIEIAMDEGIDITLDNINEMNELVKESLENSEGELSEEELEKVSGGTMLGVVISVGAIAMIYMTKRKDYVSPREMDNGRFQFYDNGKMYSE